MRCVQIDAGGAVVDVNPQPSDFSGCALVLVSGDQAGPFVLPDAAAAQTVFEFGLSVVLTVGLVGFFIGRMVNFWR